MACSARCIGVFKKALARKQAESRRARGSGRVERLADGRDQIDLTDETCTACGQAGSLRKCTKCRQAQYCDRLCQKIDWDAHNSTCAGSGSRSRTASPSGAG